MPKVVTWSLGFVLAIIMTGISPVAASDNQDDSNWPTGCVAADSSTPGTEGYTAPAPCKIDASGTDQDQYCIPVDVFEHPVSSAGMYRVKGKVRMKGCYATNGAKELVVTTDFDSGTWTFPFSDKQTGTEAANTYRIKVGKVCRKSPYSSVRFRRVWAGVTNVSDGTGWSFSAYPQVEHVRDWYSIVDTESASNILDGDTATMRVREYVNNNIRGLRPGKYKVTFWLSRTDSADIGEDYVGKRMKLTVPKCGARRR